MTTERERLDRRDWRFLAICALVSIASVIIVVRYFDDAFPETAIDFRYDRDGSQRLAETLIRQQGLDSAAMKQAGVFDVDNHAKMFLERTLGLSAANKLMGESVRVWFWHHRWFKPLQEEEFSVDVATTGEIVGFHHRIPEDRALPAVSVDQARSLAAAFLSAQKVDVNALQAVSQSERNLPKRVQRIFTWESRSIRPAGAAYRYVVTVDGNRVTDYTQRLKVPDQWRREYAELRSKNLLAGNIDLVFLIITTIAAISVFISRLRRGDMQLRFLLGVGAITIVLVIGVSLNNFPASLASYDTTTSYAAFLAQRVFGSLLQSLAAAMMLIVVCGAGDVLLRERLPRDLAISRIWTPRALTSKRVFRSFILGYTLVAFFMAYQAIFYLIAERFGAWSPAEIPYDDTLNSAFPWIMVLFAGFFPAMSEEYLSRAFSIPFFQRILRSRAVAIIAAGMIWGFGHATYPNQPFFIRGLEVGLAGIAIGYLMDGFGLLPLLIWHYTVDALYTALLLFRSGNAYYVTSAAIASLVFALPMILSIILYVRNRGFVVDDDLTNATVPVSTPPPQIETPAAAIAATAVVPVSRRWLGYAAAAVIAAAAAIVLMPKTVDDVVDYRATREEAKSLARRHLQMIGEPAGQRTIAIPVEGFRSWDPGSSREEGGAPGGYDEVAAWHMRRSGLSEAALANVFRDSIHGATWMVRSFTPSKKEEYFIEVDPRTRRVVGYHKYQNEQNAGARLKQGDAVGIAQRVFPRYGLAVGAFTLKEALSFEQPKRLDWLLHFEERNALVDSSFRRVTVRVAGDQVTQFARTIRIPDAVYRAANEQTLAHVALSILKIAGILTALSLTVAGFIIALRHRRFPWKRPLAGALLLGVIPLAGALVSYESQMFGYNTSVAWETFRLDHATGVVRNVGLQIALLFIALAAIEAIDTRGVSIAGKPTRSAIGRDAAVRAIIAVALLVVASVAIEFVATRAATASEVRLDIPGEVATPLPALLVTGQSLYAAIIGCAAVGLFAASCGAMKRRPWMPAVVAMATIFCMLVDPSVRAGGIPLMLVRCAVSTIVVWFIARRVLGTNPLAWLAAFILVSMISGAGDLLRQSRIDLQIHGAIVAALAIGFLLWLVVPVRKPEVAAA